MSGLLHLKRLQRLQKIHALLRQQQAARLAQAEAASALAARRLARATALLRETGVPTGIQQGAVLASGGQLRALLAQAMAVEARQAERSELQRRDAVAARQRMELSGQRIAARVQAARRQAEHEQAAEALPGTSPATGRATKRSAP